MFENSINDRTIAGGGIGTMLAGRYHIVQWRGKVGMGSVWLPEDRRLEGNLARRLTAEYGSGYDESNLRYMRSFYLAFPIRDALRHELSWTHYRSLMRVCDPMEPYVHVKVYPIMDERGICATQRCTNRLAHFESTALW